jgi:hypothetical protein
MGRRHPPRPRPHRRAAVSAQQKIRHHPQSPHRHHDRLGAQSLCQIPLRHRCRHPPIRPRRFPRPPPHRRNRATQENHHHPRPHPRASHCPKIKNLQRLEPLRQRPARTMVTPVAEASRLPAPQKNRISLFPIPHPPSPILSSCKSCHLVSEKAPFTPSTNHNQQKA